ncbi:MAG: hypothetical protein ABI867_07855 [Kofleriaceae bacterium]
MIEKRFEWPHRREAQQDHDVTVFALETEHGVRAVIVDGRRTTGEEVHVRTLGELTEALHKHTSLGSGTFTLVCKRLQGGSSGKGGTTVPGGPKGPGGEDLLPIASALNERAEVAFGQVRELGFLHTNG